LKLQLAASPVSMRCLSFLLNFSFDLHES
jgi:hypothetical protein